MAPDVEELALPVLSLGSPSWFAKGEPEGILKETNMFKNKVFYLIVMGFMALSVGCAALSSSHDDSDGDSDVETSGNPSEAASAGVNEVSQTLASTVSAGSPSALVKNIAGARGCFLEGDNVELSIDCNDTDHTLSVDWVMNNCTTEDGEITLTGTRHFEVTNMGDSSCLEDSNEERFWSMVQGQGEGFGAIFVHSTDPDNPTEPTASIERTYDERTATITAFRRAEFSDYTTEENDTGETVQNVTGAVQISASHVGTNSSDVTIFDFDIFTDDPNTEETETLTVGFQDVEGDYTRTIESGTIYTQRNLLGQTATHTFNHVVWNPTGELGCECNPISGTIEVTVTDNNTGETVGTGQIEFTAAETLECDSANFTYNGTPITLPLRNCE